MNWYKKCSNLESFLENPQSAWEWAQTNLSYMIEDVRDKNDDKYKEFPRDVERQNILVLKKRAEAYSKLYLSIKNKSEIVVYRMIRVYTMNHIMWNSLGVYWSFVESGAGVYGNAEPLREGLNLNVLITAMASPTAISWEDGFENFMLYGKDQWECVLFSGSPVTVIEINGKSITPKKCFV